jgi:hypothetical protein
MFVSIQSQPISAAHPLEMNALRIIDLYYFFQFVKERTALSIAKDQTSISHRHDADSRLCFTVWSSAVNGGG